MISSCLIKHFLRISRQVPVIRATNKYLKRVGTTNDWVMVKKFVETQNMTWIFFKCPNLVYFWNLLKKRAWSMKKGKKEAQESSLINGGRFGNYVAAKCHPWVTPVNNEWLLVTGQNGVLITHTKLVAYIRL